MSWIILKTKMIIKMCVCVCVCVCAFFFPFFLLISFFTYVKKKIEKEWTKLVYILGCSQWLYLPQKLNMTMYFEKSNF